MLKQFVQWNRAAALALTPSHIEESGVAGMFVKITPVLFGLPEVRVVADIGAGRTWHFPEAMKRQTAIRLIGLDIDGAEMADNPALDDRVVCDVTKGIDLPDDSVDLITVRSGIEHFQDNEAFLRHALRVLRPGGLLIAAFPGAWAPFAVINRALPAGLSRRIVHFVMPGTDHVLGFTAHYDRTTYGAFRAMATGAGYEVEWSYSSYASAQYFAFLLPLWVAAYAYDVVRYSVGFRNLASYNMFLLRKPGPKPLLKLSPWS